MILAPFRKQNAFNNLRKDEKFGIDLVDLILNTHQPSDDIFTIAICINHWIIFGLHWVC